MNTHLHDFLRINSGQSADKMWSDLSRLRRLGCKYEDITTDRREFEAGLQELLEGGGAERVGKLWLWRPVRERAEKRQASLFG